MNDKTRYDTLVVQNAAGKEIPREVDGGRVCSWARGHQLAELSALREFIDNLVEGLYDYDNIDEIKTWAEEACDKADRQSENGYDE